MSGGSNLFSSSAGSVAVVALVLSLLALAGMVYMLARQQKLLGQYQHLMTGATGTGLEEILNDHITQVRDTAAQADAVDKLARRLEKDASYHIQHVGIIRYNPFQESGGDQSFSVALVDGHGDGLILSSLHARGSTRVYGKPLQGWESGYPLAEEEKQAIDLARTSRP
jgi:hypothetical protein